MQGEAGCKGALLLQGWHSGGWRPESRGQREQGGRWPRPAALASREPEGRRGRRREKGGPRAGGVADARRKENKQGIRRGRGGAYIGVVESSWLARQGKKWAGLLIWAEKVFPIFLFAKRFNKFDLNLNSTNLNSNQTTSNKTMQSCMNANKQPHLDLEK